MTRTPCRRGFTLIELLVVMSIIVVLAALVALAANSGAYGSQKVVSAADRASGWLLIAKQRAKRDHAPRGVRFLINPTTHKSVPSLPNSQGEMSRVTDAQYVELPDPWVPTSTVINQPPFGGGRIVFVYTTQTPNPANPNIPPLEADKPVFDRRIYFVSENPDDVNELDQRVLPGDTLDLPDYGTGYRINRVIPPTDPTFQPFVLYSNAAQPVGTTANPPFVRQLAMTGFPDLGAGNSGPLPPVSTPPVFPNATAITYRYAFQPAPRVLIGEPTLQLTGGSVIDIVRPRTIVNTPPYQDWTVGVPGTGPGVNTNTPLYWPSTSIGVVIRSDPTATVPIEYFDIIFSPAGQVIQNPNGIICLWVRGWDAYSSAPKNPRLELDPSGNPTGFIDTNTLYDTCGQQIIIGISTRSGLIATHPIVPPPATPTFGYDPYKNAKDGVNSGL